MAFTNSLQRERILQNITRLELSKRGGCHEQTVVKHERISFELNAKWRSLYASALGIEEARLLPQGFVGSKVQVLDVPIIDWNTLMKLNTLEKKSLTDFVAVPNANSECIALVIDDESMSQVSPPGSYIILDPKNKNLEHLGHYVIKYDGTYMFRQIVMDGSIAFQTKSYDKNIKTTINKEFEILGRVTQIVNKI